MEAGKTTRFTTGITERFLKPPASGDN